ALKAVNFEAIPNFKNIGSSFRNLAHDPGNRYSVPYLWGTSGLVVNRALIQEERDSWAVLWNPKYRGKIAMLNNPSEVIGAALFYLGYSPNSSSLSELEQARKLLLEQKPLLAGYLDPIDIREKLIKNELWATHCYSGEGVYAIRQNRDLDYVIPKEGAIQWVDHFVIPRDAQHPETAERFINYLLEPEVSAAIANELWYANCNAAAQSDTLKEIVESPSLYPSEGTLKRCVFLKFSGSEKEQESALRFRNAIWAELQGE
ncbi:MAG: spermidine/putrescine ABC transporter substrate-binding protein, partial [Candidatus Omnitrophota bacterium]